MPSPSASARTINKAPTFSTGQVMRPIERPALRNTASSLALAIRPSAMTEPRSAETGNSSRIQRGDIKAT